MGDTISKSIIAIKNTLFPAHILVSLSIILIYSVQKSKFEFQGMTCYDLLSTEPISKPKCTGEGITLPFHPEFRYAALPRTSNSNVLQVNIYPSRPESLIHFDHLLHIMDIKVPLFIFLSWIFSTWNFWAEGRHTSWYFIWNSSRHYDCK